MNMTESLTEAIKTMLTQFLTEQKATNKLMTAFGTEKIQKQIREIVQTGVTKPKKLKDPDAPKKPVTAYMVFSGL
jgi:hypothetical protein